MARSAWWKAVCFILFFRRYVLGFATLRPSSTRLLSSNADIEVDVKIRDGKYAELNPVSDLVVQSFYDKPNEAVWKHMYRLAELNRLQQNFPYADQGRHRMLVAVSVVTNEIIGFCDVDNRPASPNIHYKCNPRPILSDLLVSPDYRRQGIARKLVEFCENTCRNEFNRDELYIRVLDDNEAAKKMYSTMGYEVFPNEGDPDNVVLLRKDLIS